MYYVYLVMNTSIAHSPISFISLQFSMAPYFEKAFLNTSTNVNHYKGEIFSSF